MSVITLENTKIFLGISGTSENASLQQIIDAVHDFVKKYTNRIIEEAIYTEELYDGSGGVALLLKNFPIIEITEILVDTEEIDERSDVDEEGWYIKDAECGIVYNNEGWTRGRGNIQVTYSAGYSSTTLPKDLQYAYYSLTSYFRNLKGKSGILSENLGSYGYTIATGLNNMLGELTIPDVIVKNILDRYKKRYISLVF